MSLWPNPCHQEPLILFSQLSYPDSPDPVKEVSKLPILPLAVVCHKVDDRQHVPQVLVLEGEVIGWALGTLEDIFSCHRLKLADVTKAENRNLAKDFGALLQLLKPQVELVQHVALDKRHLVDHHHHKLLEFNLGSVPFLILHGSELIAVAKLEGAGESQPTDV